jgi:hypothetical protein
MFMRSSLLLVGAAGLAAMGCSATAVDQPDAEPTSSTATAIVVVERTMGPGDTVRGDAVVARFVRVRQGAVDDPALRIAGIAQDIPTLGTCATTNDTALAATTSFEAPRSSREGSRDGMREVELLDVGTVTVDGLSGKSTALLPRAMPDPAGVVSGVFYSARSADVFAPGGSVALRASGSRDLDGFAVNAIAPRDVGDVRVTSAATGLDVAWDASDLRSQDTTSSAQDLVYVDVLAPAPRVVARCAVADAGRMLVGASILGALREGDEGQLAVHRVHREAFRAKGIEPGEVRFDLAKVVTFRR